MCTEAFNVCAARVVFLLKNAKKGTEHTTRTQLTMQHIRNSNSIVQSEIFHLKNVQSWKTQVTS